MNQTVSITDKKEMIRWFLKRYQMKRRECVWILNYLLSHDDMLKKVHFVEEAHYCPLGMVMSANGVEGAPFGFHKEGISNTDAEKAFHDLRLRPNEERYIQLNFSSVPVSIEYLSVLEENPFIPKYISRVNEKDAKIAEQLIEHVMKMSYQNNLSMMIDEALDNGDKELFMKLTSQMVSL